MIGTILWPEAVEATATVVGSIGVVAALTYTARQTHALRNQANLQREEAARNVEVQQASLEIRLIELTISIDKLFLDRPHLRPFFYENRRLPWWMGRKRRVEVIATAEVMIDFVDAIASLRRHGQISDRDYENWRVFTEGYYQQSPAVRDLWDHWGEFYMPETAELFAERDGPSNAHTEPRRHWPFRVRRRMGRTI